MKYTQARQLVEAALEIVLNEGMMPRDKMEYSKKEYTSKPSMPTVKKPTSPSPSSGTSPSPVVKMGARKTSARWRRGNRWVLKQIKKRQASAVNEMAQTNARYRQMGDKIEKATVAYNEGKPGAGRKWRKLLKQDEREARSATLYGRGGKKIKNPKKHRDSRPLGEESEDVLLEFDPKRGEDGRATPLAHSLDAAREKGLRRVEGKRHKRLASLSPAGQHRLRSYRAGRNYVRNQGDFDPAAHRTGGKAARSPDVRADLDVQDRARFKRGH